VKSKNEYLIDTDVLIEHLYHDNRETSSLLENLSINGMLFTSAINASEMIFEYGNEKDYLHLLQLLNAIKVLGIHSRYSLSVSEYCNSVETFRDALFCVVAKINKLTIVTLAPEKYIRTGLNIINGLEVKK
jgi:predicted nucleic acid-binding protein